MTGVNESILHEGVGYHVQIEDLPGERAMDVRVYVGGRVLFHKRHSYAQAILNPEAPSGEGDVAIQEREKLLVLVRAAIQRGRIKA